MKVQGHSGLRVGARMNEARKGLPKERGSQMRGVTSLGLVLIIAAAFVIAQPQSRAEMGWWDDQSPRSAAGDSKQGKATAQAVCAGCHGADGNSSDPRYPKLAGQSETYIYRQLQSFKMGGRKSDIMADIVKALSDADMANVASFYSQERVQPDAIADAGLAALGQDIFFAGVGSGMMSACVMCHGRHGVEQGMPMMGMMGDAPRLNGQHAAYIVDQLNRFSSGERQSDIMGDIASALTEMDRKAVAEFLSGLR
ncbi:MAG: cytochrome c4 [Hyphomicrobium sp.]|nr:MAG: cytochrome c4 [Hyphomicrobium sp.]